jgi:hypothetical protein
VLVQDILLATDVITDNNLLQNLSIAHELRICCDFKVKATGINIINLHTTVIYCHYTIIPSYCVIKQYFYNKEGKSAASFCCKGAAWFPDMFCNFYLVKNHKILKTQQPLMLEKNKHRFGILRILAIF